MADESTAWVIFHAIRRVTVFLLGVAVILDSLISSEQAMPELIVGMIMVGVLPIENLSLLWARRRDR